MKVTTKVVVKVPASMTQEGTACFPRIRLIGMLRAFHDFEGFAEAKAMVEEAWPEDIRSRQANWATWDTPYKSDVLEDGVNQWPYVRLVLITDDAGIGRIVRAVHRLTSMEFEIIQVEELKDATYSYIE